MKNIWKLLAVLAVAGGLAACDKVNGDDGPSKPGEAEAVDLGLSVKWASYNVGATAPEEYGSYFAWGETVEKENYDWSKPGEYKWGTYDGSSLPDLGMFKYTTVDGLTILQKDDDAATAAWGSKWRTPTADEFEELLDETKCVWTREKRKDADGKNVNGFNVTSKVPGYQGNSIFLPEAFERQGTNSPVVNILGCYWSSTIGSDVSRATSLIFGIYEDNTDNRNLSPTDRKFGLSVRAVTEY